MSDSGHWDLTGAVVFSGDEIVGVVTGRSIGGDYQILQPTGRLIPHSEVGDIGLSYQAVGELIPLIAGGESSGVIFETVAGYEYFEPLGTLPTTCPGHIGVKLPCNMAPPHW